MSEQDLQDRMSQSTAWTALATNDPAEDITRGRSRLRRRRTAIGVTTMSAVAVAALGVNALAGQFGTGGGVEPGLAGDPAPTTPARPNLPGRDVTNSLAAKYGTAMLGHIDPDQKYVAKVPFTAQAVGARNPRSGDGLIGELYTFGQWKQAGGVADLSIRVSHFNVKQPNSLHCGQKSAAPGFLHFTCSWKTLPNGQKVQVGTALTNKTYKGTTYKNIKSMIAYYLRPDGQTVEVAYFGIGSNSVEAPLMNKPVLNPDLTVDQLVAAVTDPAMTLNG